MLALRVVVALVVASVLVGCGARSALDDAGAGAGATSSTSSGAGGAGTTCGGWVATSQPVQVSNTASIIEPQEAVVTSAGVLVGYADELFPPVDASWHARAVTFGDAALGPEEAVFQRDTSGLGWTAISIARGFGRMAATASDDTQGMAFVTVDENGAPTGEVTYPAGDPGRNMLATSTGFSVLRSPFDPSGGRTGPVTVAALDPAGNVVGERTLLDATLKMGTYGRVAFADGSFSLVWSTQPACAGCTATHAQHFDEAGNPLSADVTLRSFTRNSYVTTAMAASASGLLLAWAERSTSGLEIVAAAFDAEGQAVGGGPHIFARFAGENPPALALAAAPGGDFIAAWVDQQGEANPKVHVQSVAADGTAEGDALELASVVPGSDERVFVVASPLGAMVMYSGDVANFGIEVYAIALRCGS